MPFTFVEIEQKKNKAVVFLFTFLIAFYFLSAYIVAVVVRFFFFGGPASIGEHLFFSVPLLSTVLFIAVVGAAVHWCFSISGMTGRILDSLQASKLDPEDSYHQLLKDIVDEVSVATGGKNIECVVLPAVALNAFSLSDFQNRAVIGITEGLLARLNREQIEAVVAHEAAHIVSGDSLLKSVSVSLFGVYAIIISALERSKDEDEQKEFNSLILYPQALVLYLVLKFFYLCAKLISMCISRQCEYRADAIAVRLARNPLGLVQALYMIGRNWRGFGLGYEYIESIFIFNPYESRLDERDDFFAGIFSTHPPLWKRLKILLDMAHCENADLAAETAKSERPRVTDAVSVVEPPAMQWFAAGPNGWVGPFNARQLLCADWFRYDMFVRRKGTDKVTLMYEDSDLSHGFKGTMDGGQQYTCPRCGQELEKALYEGAPIHTCRLCRGRLVGERVMPRIIIREEQGFSPEVIRQAVALEMQMDSYPRSRTIKGRQSLVCPLCKSAMFENYYTLVYPVMVDRCIECKSVWFDKNELEVVQFLMETRT